MIGFFRFGLRGFLLSVGLLVCITLFIFVIDAIEFARQSTVQEIPSEHGLKRYADRVSEYSLVNLGVLQISSDQDTIVDAAPLFACLGKRRYQSERRFVDITALTLSVIGVETYNRNAFRRVVEIYAQDIVQMLGGAADYTIGIGQIKSSLAEQIYRSKINAQASPSEIKEFARSDCGSARLAALLIDGLVSACDEDVNNSSTAQLIGCIIGKYTGMKDKTSRQFVIYTDAVAHSYDLLFDLQSEFYLTKVLEWMGISRLKGGECLEFNVGGAELAANPIDRSQQAVSGAYSGEEYQAEFITIGDQRVRYVAVPSILPSDIVKIIVAEKDSSLANHQDPQVSAARRKFILQMACAMYHPASVQFYPRPDELPTSLARPC